MAINERLARFLAQEHVTHEILAHRTEFTAQRVAESAHIPGAHLAKVLLLREHGGALLMLVVPAPCRVDLTALETAGAGQKFSLASEDEIQRCFPDCEVGAMPPFGGLYDLPVYVDACFPRGEEFVFQAGNHHEVVRMRYADYERLVQPVVGEFCRHAREKSATE
jgi:Ala-tRNA(Pro) deacylase